MSSVVQMNMQKPPLKYTNVADSTKSMDHFQLIVDKKMLNSFL